ncbi:hypothetical protein PR003_g13275 [Phytophthora rubi]|uniref:Uncharacterized protein n=1 Tax=Phytophthora rubi TaxID=129364 RepID=A0A6A4F651_9STRA|nr:hypothetical protein PR002_g12651 [Phytophthora rubi]KAE9024968.1 hypothetical protein PR001_g12542 [Phytophthora rubi]KAE9334924.1 hypothetical protein PR003_g13275 [Phytophthora rubi]
MSSDAHDVSTAETQDVGADGTSLDEDNEEESKWRQELNSYRASIGEAEEACVFLVEDLLAAIFQEMQVRSENASLFATSARQMCAQAFESVDMSAFEPSDSLDRIPGATEHGSTGRQQVLKRQSRWAPSPRSRNRSSDASGLGSSLPPPPPPLLFLRRLSNFLENRADRADLELQRFNLSESILSLSGKRKLMGIASASASDGVHYGEWCISVDHISAFLQEVLAKGLVSAVPSTIQFVMKVNQESLEKKLHSQTRIALPHLQQLVQKALLTAEEEEESNHEQRNRSRPVSMSKVQTDSESTPRSRIFQTEVPFGKVNFSDVLKRTMEMPDQPEVGPEQELLSSYLEEVAPRAIEMDRRAPGHVATKAALSAANPSQRAISRKVLLMMAPSPRQGSRWKTVRHKLVVPAADESGADGVMTITAEADMELHLAGDKSAPPKHSTSTDRKAPGLSIQTSVATGALTESEEMADAAALSNIFSLGTPRQLSALELARRNDLLAQLEREAAYAQRRAPTTLIASMSLGGPSVGRESDGSVCPSQADHQQFQAYVAANSIVTTGITSGALSPTRPQQNDQAAAAQHRGRGSFVRSKFELERDTLPFTVSDGNAHVREEQERLSAAMCSPIKRPRASVVVPTPPPETPGRPIQTAFTLAHLPQLDSSRLAVGVSAVVRGVEKRGPRRNPSRNSRLQLHNYSTAFDGVDDQGESEVKTGGKMPFSPVRTSGPPSFAAAPSKGASAQGGSYRLPLIPVVSPIKASPHRKHVAFKFQNGADNERAPETISPKAHVRQRSSPKIKQPVWEAKTRSPPRSRNPYFASGRNFRKAQRPGFEDDGESSSARRQKEEEQAANMFRQPMAAPRRNDLPTTSELDDES